MSDERDLNPDKDLNSSRRNFLRNASLACATAELAALVPGPLPTLASTDTPMASGKNLPEQWLASLNERGQPTVYHGNDLTYIGMPVGGITTGQLYLGGDGKLWLWDIFNQTKQTSEGGAEHYTNPLIAASNSSVDQAFTWRVFDGGSGQVRPLSSEGFSDISFRGQYPIGFVEYRDPASSVTFLLEAFSPFIPLNVDDSSLPAAILRFTVTNTATNSITGELTGLLENAVARSANHVSHVKRVNRVIRESDLLLLDCSAVLPASGSYPDAGTMGLALLSPCEADTCEADVDARPEDRPAGALTKRFSLAPGESQVATFAVVWCFPNLTLDWSTRGFPPEPLALKSSTRRHYATRFDSATAVARYLARDIDRLYAQTKLWHDTWYISSTLPHWFLERTLLNVSTLATSTCYRFADGRFYGSEGVGGGPGTATHVWATEQAMGRLFPDLDRSLREQTDFNPAIAFNPDGRISVRGELAWEESAIDGQATIILRTLRNHQTSVDDTFLKRNWPSIKKAMQWLIEQDSNADGILEGPQANTLDAIWYGAIAWLSSLYLAALRASEEMALDVGDRQFAVECRQIFHKGRTNIVQRLFLGEYFVNQPDPQHPEAINSGNGCEIDQVLGQSWAFQVGLGRVLPVKETLSALSSLWRYNFLTDVGPYRALNSPGRWYAMPGEAGMLMCTFSRGDWDFRKAGGTGQGAQGVLTVGYFNECMTGFEHQVAAHMIWEGMIQEGLAIERAIHDRYHASRRNPWNEVECGDHYARAMASHGVYIAACGYEYHGPKGYIAFAPRIRPENFEGAFTAARGWGSFAQVASDRTFEATITLKYGDLSLRTIVLSPLSNHRVKELAVSVNDDPVTAKMTVESRAIRVELINVAELRMGDRMRIVFS